MIRTVISPTDLQDKTREIVERVRHGEMAVVKTSGEEQIVLLDATDYRLLRALAACAIDASELEEKMPSDARILRDYLDDEISLGKAAEELGLSRFDLAERFHRLEIPLPFGPTSLEDARSEIAAMRKTRLVTSSSE
ncbi:MAG TPA: type II toxin-antitoxin system prevent-host-death family antitoxin [Thermoanaerobaculia bacterium]|nr:type II toxin-antitoxin system prevent-host-death family antitoxin [Thermoanaerobaculia bacterium]